MRDRMLDGDRRWGSLSIHTDRMGLTRYRVVVYPPGIDDTERRRLRVARGWPVWGPMLWLGCEVVLAHSIGPWPALIVSTAISVGAGAIAAAWAGPQRTRVRMMTVNILAGHHDPASATARVDLLSMAAVLLEADAQLGRNDISLPAYEMAWWQVYDRMSDHRISTDKAV